MKKLLFALMAVVLIAPACKKIKSVTQINTDIPYDQNLALVAVDTSLAGLVLPGGGLGIRFPPTGVPSNAQDFFDQYHTSASQVISAKLKTLNINLVGGRQTNFDFADTIELYLSAKGLPEKLVAYTYHIPKGVQALELTTSEENLKQYFVQDSFFFSEFVHFNAVPYTGSSLNIHSVWNLIANPLN
ncbi:MAG: hypothetical protein EBZ77_02470 [Chitinophagia bacterium]|nr:hypothetical protein [Chitinophagia bacterium]